MENLSKQNFVQALKLLAHQTVHNYYQKLEEFPADREFQKTNGFFASVLYDVAFSREPIEEEYADCGTEDLNYQVAKGIYQNWIGIPIENLAESYCKLISTLIEKKAAEKCKGGYYFTFDYVARAPDVLKEIECARAQERMRYNWDKCTL